MIRSTTPSEDEDDLNNPNHFLTPSLDISFSPHNGVVEINHNDNDSIHTDDLSQSTTIINIPQYHTYFNLSSSSSETSLIRPLLNEKHQNGILYTENIKINSSDSLTLNSYSFIKLYLTDMFISAFLITPLVNIHWRGAWDLLDIYLLPKNERTSALVSLLVGLFILYFIYLIQNSLQIFYEKYRKNFFGQIMTRFYTLIIALAYINQWRGLWNLLDLTSNQWYHLIIETLISIIFLSIMKSIYNLNSAPFLIGIDTESYFLLGSKYNISTNRFWQYTFDFLLYEIVEAPLVVIAWRGLYNLSDLYIYPDNKFLSMLISFTIGYLLFFLLALLQIPFIQCFIKKQHKTMYTFISNLFHLFAFISVVQIWRSLWIICEQYINIEGYHHLTLWLCYIVAFVVLTCGLAACTLNGPGGAKDNYIDDQPNLVFKFDYFSTLFKVN
jgi:succinate dehydrogenase hydrophobic anchor subunit